MVGKLSIKVDKEFVDGYRNYKIDLINGKSVKDLRYMVFQDILENSKFKFADIVNEFNDKDVEYVNISTDNISTSRSFNNDEFYI